MEPVVLTASANTGIGLWTMICVGFSAIFGCQSYSYKRKQEKILGFANDDLESQLRELGPSYILSEYRVSWSSRLAVTVSALAIDRNSQPYLDKESNDPIEILREALKQLECGRPKDDVIKYLEKHNDKTIKETVSLLSHVESKTITISTLRQKIRELR